MTARFFPMYNYDINIKYKSVSFNSITRRDPLLFACDGRRIPCMTFSSIYCCYIVVFLGRQLQNLQVNGTSVKKQCNKLTALIHAILLVMIWSPREGTFSWLMVCTKLHPPMQPSIGRKIRILSSNIIQKRRTFYKIANVDHGQSYCFRACIHNARKLEPQFVKYV